MSEPIVIYPLKEKASKWKNNEIRFSLRSLDKYFRMNDGSRPKVFLLTVAEIKFLNSNVIRIPCKGYIGAMKMAWKLAREHSPTGDYVWMNDDIAFMQNTTPADLIPAIHTGSMTPYRGETPSPTVGGWRLKLCALRDRLADMGLTPYNFSTHSPYLFNADLMEITAGLFGLKFKLPLETAYFNYWADRIPSRRSDNRFVRHTMQETLPLDCRDKRFLNYADGGLNPLLKGFIHGLFPNPGFYEYAD
jgi:hypothetical protein